MQEGAEVSPFGDDLRTTQVKVDCVAVNQADGVLDGPPEDVRVVGAKLDNEGSVLGTSLEHLLSVLFVSNKDAGVEHGRVAQVGAVAAGQEPPCQLAALDHRSDHILSTFQVFLVKFKAFSQRRHTDAALL